MVRATTDRNDISIVGCATRLDPISGHIGDAIPAGGRATRGGSTVTTIASRGFAAGRVATGRVTAGGIAPKGAATGIAAGPAGSVATVTAARS
ncbi:MAG: hypothetical protein M9947_05200 [Thermomicrobiales bacterium]|nr:hypothetical protein [Thermomicrobiales bacterium]